MPYIDAGSCEPLRIFDRLEPRTREVDFAAALSAPVHDAAFLLARQWQFGEFAGEDAGSAVLATLARRVTPVAPPAGATAEDGLEPVMERLPIDFPPLLRARLGRTVLTRLAAAAAAAGPLTPAYDSVHYRDLFRDVFGVAEADPADPVGSARDRAAPRVARVRAALRGKAVDGVRVFEALSPGMLAAQLPADLTTRVFPGHVGVLLTALEGYRAWFAATYRPAGGEHWRGDRLEYDFSVTAARDGGTVELTAAEHVAGRLDWYSFDHGTRTSGAASASVTDLRTVIPVPAEFPGMPKPRWWQFENAAVDLGKLRADTTDVARIVVGEFALLYGNNWFTVTCRQPVGTIAELQGVIVTDVFGTRTLVPPASDGGGPNWTGWDAFSLSPRPSGPATAPLPQHLYVPAALTHVQDGTPQETVLMVRDESADMVWAVEQRVPDGLGGSRDGAEAARRLRQELGPPPAQDADPGAGLRWVAQTEVAEHWIPFLPVRVPGSDREIRLQRGALLRQLPPPLDARIRPVTSILRAGISAADSAADPYYVDDEEVPRAGVTVTGMLRRARRYDGVPVVWHARAVSTGRGGGSSGLAFDVLEGGGP